MSETELDMTRVEAFGEQVLGSMNGAGTALFLSLGHRTGLFDPIGPMLYMFSVFYCMTTALSQGGVGVGTAWGDQLCRQYLADAGFTAVDARTVEGDIFNVYYVCQKT